MRIVENLKSLRFDRGDAAPDLCEAYEKQLMIGQIDAGQCEFRLVIGHPLLVSLQMRSKWLVGCKNFRFIDYFRFT